MLLAPSIALAGEWCFVEERAAGTGAFTAEGARFTVDADGREILRYDGYAGRDLSSIAALEYQSIQESGGNAIYAVSLQFDVAGTRLVYEPYYTETMQVGVWQTWSPLDGVWWGVEGCPITDACPWDEVKDRAIEGDLLLKAGGPWPGGFVGVATGLRIAFADGTDDTWEFTSGPAECPDEEQDTGGDTGADVVPGDGDVVDDEPSVEVECGCSGAPGASWIGVLAIGLVRHSRRKCGQSSSLQLVASSPSSSTVTHVSSRWFG